MSPPGTATTSSFVNDFICSSKALIALDVLSFLVLGSSNDKLGGVVNKQKSISYFAHNSLFFVICSSTPVSKAFIPKNT